MATTERLAELKDDNRKIFIADLEGTEIVFRPLTFKEYDSISTHLELGATVTDVEDYVVESAILDPTEIDLDDFKPGSITALAERVLDVSAFNDPDLASRAMDEAREAMMSIVQNVMKSFIYSVFPKSTITDDYLDNLTLYDMAYEAAMAERVIYIQQQSMGIEGLDVSLKFRMIGEEPEEEAPEPHAPQFEDYEMEHEIMRSHHPSHMDDGTTLGTATVDDPIAQRLLQDLG